MEYAERSIITFIIKYITRIKINVETIVMVITMLTIICINTSADFSISSFVVVAYKRPEGIFKSLFEKMVL